MLERQLEAKLKALVKSLGGLCFKLDPKADKGVPDRVIALPGRTPFFLELKTETGVVSPLQAHKHEQLRKAGQRIVVARGWQEIEDAIKS
jgi:hypothetical protein